MKKIRLSKAKKKVLAALERQRDEMMVEMKGEAIAYYAKVVFCTLKNVCDEKDLQPELYKVIGEISVKNVTDTIKSMAIICGLLEDVGLPDMSNLAAVITEGKVSVIRDFLVEFLKVAFFSRIEPEDEDEFFEDDDIFDEYDDDDFQDSAAGSDVLDEDYLSEDDLDKAELEEALFGTSGCKGDCKFGMKVKDLRICKKCKHFLSEEPQKSECDGCMGASMGDCDVCEKNKEVTESE